MHATLLSCKQLLYTWEKSYSECILQLLENIAQDQHNHGCKEGLCTCRNRILWLNVEQEKCMRHGELKLIIWGVEKGDRMTIKKLLVALDHLVELS